jgi:NAD(P)-dependent dehydrogenase (short-subunit alcohol dehydrogenase family)
MNRFTDRTVLITGGTSGMGLATAHRLVAEGAQVVVTGRTRERVDTAVEALGPNSSGVVADVTDLRAVDALMETVREPYGHLDNLFANAGVGTFLPFEDITEADFDHAVDVNLKGGVLQRTSSYFLSGRRYCSSNPCAHPWHGGTPSLQATFEVGFFPDGPPFLVKARTSLWLSPHAPQVAHA